MTPSFAFEKPGIRGFLHLPAKVDGRGLVLTHGAGGNCAAPLLVAGATAFAQAGLIVLRCDLPFRQRRPSGPPSPAAAAADRAGLIDAVEAVRALGAHAVLLGGVSYGGRQASLLAAERPALAAGLLLLSYPLHAPGKPDRLRTEHFVGLRTPAVFVHGTADPFGTIAELRGAVALIAAPTALIAIEGAGHDLKRGRLDWTLVVASLLPFGATA
jgi:predicted alpha/beta-hydrolase family hydrolase